jgi:DNA helicase II / ATP-dependent DNA helicase PcrA
MPNKTKINNTQVSTAKQNQTGFAKMYSRLNPEQKNAVDAIEGPVMVLAGPGTGKTQVLAMRVANILRKTQMDPWNILCLTFTETAAAEMRQRLISIIGEAAYYVKINTFHAFCNEVIQDNPEKFLLGRSSQALSSIEKAELWRKLFDGLSSSSPLKPFGRPYMFIFDTISAVQLLKKEGVGTDQLVGLIDKTEEFTTATKEVVETFTQLSVGERDEKKCLEFAQRLEEVKAKLPNNEPLWLPFMDALKKYKETNEHAEGKREASKLRTELKNNIKKYYEDTAKQIPKQRELAKLYDSYQKELQKSGQYDFEDMILQVVQKFSIDDELLARYQEQFQYILIDEYQDTNGAQNEAVRLLGSFDTRPNIFVVGDDKQSIFRFQGASLDNLLGFYRDYQSDVKIVSLQNNYRSEQLLIDATLAVINNNKESVQKYIPQVINNLTAQINRKTAVLDQAEYLTEDEECFGVAQKIKELINKGEAPDDIAVLYRFNKDAIGLIEALKTAGVAYRLEAKEDALADERVQQLITLLEVASCEPSDISGGAFDQIISKLIHFDFLQLDPVDVVKVIYFAGHERCSLYKVISSKNRLIAAEVDNKESFLHVAKQIAEWRVYANNHVLPQVFDVILKESGLLKGIAGSSDEMSSLNKINTLFGEIKRVSVTDNNISIKQLTERLALMSEDGLRLQSGILRVKDGAVRLMTAHSAKGLEFEHVFVLGLVDRHWGNNRDRNMVKLPRGIVRFDPVNKGQNNEDERRLFYVALTRAKVGIHLSYAKLGASGKERVPSLFLLEMPEAKVNKSTHHSTDQETKIRLRRQHAELDNSQNKEIIKDWLRTKLQNYTMSVTHLNNYLECPQLFYYRNLLRVPAAKNKHMSLGTAAHNALRDLYSEINIKGVVPSKKSLLKAYENYLTKEVLAKKDHTDSLSYGEEALGEYYERYKGVMSNKKTLLEYSFKSHRVWVIDGQQKLQVTGQLDKLELLGNQKVNVVDYKTGNPDNAYQHSKPGGKYYRQLVFYKLLCDESQRFNYEMVSGEIDFIQPSKRKGEHIKHKYKISNKEVEELKKEVLRVWEEVQELKFINGKESCGECEYCKVNQ